MKGASDIPGIATKAPEGVRADGTPFRVMVVDDSIFIAKQIGQILTSEGFEVITTAGDGEEAVKKYQELQSKIDLVTMDITMPKWTELLPLRRSWNLIPMRKSS